jgi:catechol 2,3-dioxygenase-like lactoylglutathione lyase family enzyme
MKMRRIDHVTLHVSDLRTSGSFYGDLLALQPIARPALSVPGLWFALPSGQQLHLIGERTDAVVSAIRGTHVAFEVDDLPAFQAHLAPRGVIIDAPRPNPQGGISMYIRDPDGHVVELYTPPRGRSRG